MKDIFWALRRLFYLGVDGEDQRRKIYQLSIIIDHWAAQALLKPSCLHFFHSELETWRDNRLTFSLRKLLDFLYSKSHRLEMIYLPLYGSISYYFIPAPWSKPLSYVHKKYSNAGYKIWRRLTSSKWYEHTKSTISITSCLLWVII